MKSLPASFSASIPEVDGLQDVIKQSNDRLSYHAAAETLTVHGALEEDAFRALLACYGKHDRRTELEGVLRDLRDRSALKNRQRGPKPTTSRHRDQRRACRRRLRRSA